MNAKEGEVRETTGCASGGGVDGGAMDGLMDAVWISQRTRAALRSRMLEADVMVERRRSSSSSSEASRRGLEG